MTTKVRATVLRPFRVFVGSEEGERKVRFRTGQKIECTPEQLDVGKAAGLLREGHQETGNDTEGNKDDGFEADRHD
jgi:hypothetical protein